MWIIFILVVVVFWLIYSKKNAIKKSKYKNIVPLGYKLFYTDQNTKEKEDNVIYKKILYSEKYNIQGKPDYIFKRFNSYYPIELKSGSIKDDPMPHLGDLMQLVAYFIIIEDLYGHRVKEGKLVYKDYCFRIKNTRRLRKYFFKVLSDMRHMLKTGKGNPTCSFTHCKYCICRHTVCEFYRKLS